MRLKNYLGYAVAVTSFTLVANFILPAYASNTNNNHDNDSTNGSQNSNGNNDNKNQGGCDQNGSTGDLNGKPCNPGHNHASEEGCEHGEPDCATPTPTQIPTTYITPSCTPTPTLEPSLQPTETPTATPTETPAVSATPTPTGSSSNNNSSNSSNTSSGASTNNTEERVLGVSAFAPTGDFLSNLAQTLKYLSDFAFGGTLLYGLYLFYQKKLIVKNAAK